MNKVLKKIGLLTLESIICLTLSYIAYHIHGIIDLKFMIGGLAGVICTLMMVYLDN